MLRIVICDDDASVRALLGGYVDRYARENGIETEKAFFPDGRELLAADLSGADLLILDIQMPSVNGLDAARAVRAAHPDLMIIFFTSYIQYALEGYEVQAFRFLLKPLDYAQFAQVVGGALTKLNELRGAYWTLRVNDALIRLPIGEIAYVESDRNRLLIHSRGGTTACRMTIKSAEDALAGHSFFRCHKAFLVALREIREVALQDVVLRDGARIPLSKHRKRALRETLTVFWGDQFL